MVKLKSEQCIRIKRVRPTQIYCVAGVVWITQQGDLHDYILGPGDTLQVAQGLTLLTALEPSMVEVERARASTWREHLGQLHKLAQGWIERWAGKNRGRARNGPVPYY